LLPASCAEARSHHFVGAAVRQIIVHGRNNEVLVVVSIFLTRRLRLQRHLPEPRGPFIFVKMESRAESLRAEAEKCRQQAAKAATATAMFIYLDLAADFLEKAKHAELEDGNSDIK
jgi:hypothetical protein